MNEGMDETTKKTLPPSNPSNQHRPKKETSFPYFMAHVSAIALARTAIAPLDRVQYILQTDAELVKSKTLTQRFANPLECAKHLIRQEGVRGLWRGNITAVNLALTGPLLAHVMTNHVLGPFLASRDSNTIPMSSVVACCASLGVIVLMYPLSFARTRLACDVQGIKNRQFTGAVDVWRKVYKADGIAGIYRGFGLKCMGYSGGPVGVALYSLFSLVVPKQYKPAPDSKAPSMICFGLAAATTYLFDTGSRRAMVTSGEEWKYRNSKQALVRILRSDGWMALFRGSAVAVVGYFTYNLLHRTLQTWINSEMENSKPIKTNN